VLVQVGASIALGGVLHHLVERPLMAPRPARSSLRRRDLLVAGGAVAVLAASLFVPARQASVDFDRPALAAGAVGAAGSSDLPGIGLFGGSTAYTLTSGMPAWAEAHGSVRLTEGRPVVRCGIVTEGLRNERLRAGDPNFERPPEDCRWHDAWPAAVRSQAIDVAVIKASIWDLRTWILDGDGEERQIGDAVFDEHLAGLLADAVDRLTAAGATDVVLVTHLPPHPDLSTEEAADRAERNARYRRIAEEVARSHPAAHLADLTTWIESQPPEQIVQLAPVDRAHPDLEQSSIIWTEFLGPFIAEHTSSVAPTT
jgi:hypothetical protein